MAKGKKLTVLVTLCSLLVGVLLMFQLKAQADKPRLMGSDNVVAALAPYTSEIEQLQAENDKLQTELDQYMKGEEASQVASDRLKRAQLLAGLTPVEGPGLEIILDDSKQAVASGDDVDKYIIHEQYLRALVNALWNSKAEGIAINGQRLSANSAIYCTGTVITINDEVETPPYKIEAIGDSEKLSKSVEVVEKLVIGLDEYVQLYGITFEKNTVKHIQLPAAALPNYKFAVPVKEGS